MTVTTSLVPTPLPRGVLSKEEVEIVRKEARLRKRSFREIAASWGLEEGHVRFIASRKL